MITAEQAREIAGPTVEEMVESLDTTIKALSEQKRRRCRTGYDHSSDEKLWISGGYSQSDDWKKAKAILETYGYKVSFFYEERQFVDMYTLIEW